MPLPFFTSAERALWHAAIGYEIAGIVGILLIGGAIVGLARLLGAPRALRDDRARGRTA